MSTGINIIKKSRTLPMIIVMIALVGTVFFVYKYSKWSRINPFTAYEYEDVASATKDREGNTYVIAGSGKDILKISPDGKLVAKISGSDSGFSGATHIAVGGDERIYVHTVNYSEGVHIGDEGLIRFDKDGKRDESFNVTVFCMGGDLKQNIAGLIPTENGLIYIRKESFGIALYNQDKRFIDTFSLADADENVISVTYDKASDTLYYTTYSGQVFSFTKGGEPKEIFKCTDIEGSIPQDICLCDGRIYVADVGLKNVLVWSLKDKSWSVVTEAKPVYDREVAAVITAGTGGVVLTSENSVYDVTTETVICQDYPDLSTMSLIKVLAIWVASILCAVLLILSVVTFFIHMSGSSNTGTQITFGIIIVVTAIGALFLGTLFPNFQEQFENEVYAREQQVAKTIINSIEDYSVFDIKGPADSELHKYPAIKMTVDFSFLTGEIDDFYCMIYHFDGDTVRIVYSLEDIYFGYPSDYTMEELEDLSVGEFQRVKSSTSQGTYIYVMYPYTDDNGEIAGFIEVGTDTEKISEKNIALLKRLIINVLAMIVVSVLVVIEAASYIRGKAKVDLMIAEGKTVDRLPPELFRFIVFIIFFFTNLTCAILPIYSMRLAQDLWAGGKEAELFAAIPISAEVLSGAIFSAIGGSIIRKLGNKRTIALTSALFTIGLALRVAPNLVTLTLAAFVLGAGWGVQLLMVNVLIARLPEEEKDSGYAHYNIASLAGANSAVVLGGFLVQWISYDQLFVITAVSSVMLYFVSRKYLVDVQIDDDDKTEDEEGMKKQHINALRFVFKPKVLIFFLFMLTPLLIAGYFLQYMFPIIGSEWGISDTYIGYSFVLSGLFSVIFGSKTTEFFSKRHRKGIGLFITVVIYALAFLLVAEKQTVVSLYIALVMLGIADSFGIPLLSNYFTDLKEVALVGYDKAFGIYSLFENGAQSLGSLVFGSLFIIGVDKGLKILLAILLSMAFIFLITSFFGRGEKVSTKKEASET